MNRSSMFTILPLFVTFSILFQFSHAFLLSENNGNGSHACADDAVHNCWAYEDIKCIGKYEAWSRRHCPYRCGYCPELPPCVDLIPNCDEYSGDICGNGIYGLFARTKCRRYCNFCHNASDTSGNKDTCSDLLSDCHLYHDSMCSHREFATKNCQKTCHVCSDLTARKGFYVALNGIDGVFERWYLVSANTSKLEVETHEPFSVTLLNESQPLPSQLRITNTSVSTKGIKASNSDSVILYHSQLVFPELIYKPVSSASIIPYENIGISYVIPSYFPSKNTERYFSVVATHSGTEVDITFKINATSMSYNNKRYRSGDNLKIVLNEFEVFTFWHTVDFSGTSVESNEKIAVECGAIGNAVDESMAESVLPITRWGTEFVIPPTHSKQLTIQIITYVSSTVLVQIESRKESNTILLSNSMVRDLEPGSMYTIKANASIYITALASAKNNAKLCMTITIPPVTLYRTQSSYFIPKWLSGKFNEHYVLVMTKASEFHKLSFNAQSVFSYLSNSTAYYADYVVITLTSKSGLNEIKSVDGLVHFGAIIFGDNQGYSTCYGTTLNM